jgi:hypothetical protein
MHFSRPGPAEQLRDYVEHAEQRRWSVLANGNGSANAPEEVVAAQAGDDASAGVVVDQPSKRVDHLEGVASRHLVESHAV